MASVTAANEFASFAIYHQTKMAEDVEKNAYIHFVVERDFKEALQGSKRSRKT